MELDWIDEAFLTVDGWIDWSVACKGTAVE
jgi:hypothetical protein